MVANRPNAAPLKVINLGLPRTGTSSMREALTVLGFGPCLQSLVTANNPETEFRIWPKVADGDYTVDDLDRYFRGYHSVVDVPAALYAAELYAAYPDAKFILTTRDPAKWEKSIRATIFRLVDSAMADKSLFDRIHPDTQEVTRWIKTYYLDRYHGGRLATNAQQEFHDHTERIKRIIPPEQLLVYESGEGWDRLADFLGVPKPAVPYPKANDAEQFQTSYVDKYTSVVGVRTTLVEA